jgi:hypothetical protein
MTNQVVPGFTVLGVAATAALAVLDLHTSDDPSPSAVSSATAEPTATAKGKGCGCLPRWLARTLLLAIGGLAVFSGACLDACTSMNTIRHVPAIHGRVVDMETSEPLAGVKITRWFERQRIVGPGGVEPYVVDGSLRTVTTGADGRFDFPSWIGILRGVDSVRWTEFKPGWVAAHGSIDIDAAPWLGLFAKTSQPYVRVESHRENSDDLITLRVHRVDTPGATEEVVLALGFLVDEGLLSTRAYATQIARHLAQHPVTERMLVPLATLTDRINPHAAPGLASTRCELLKGIVTYCRSNSSSQQCRYATVQLCLRDYSSDCQSRE